jgi:hypothetical protein
MRRPVHQFLMQELGTLFQAPGSDFDGLVFALFLQFCEELRDQRSAAEDRWVDAVRKARPAGGIRFPGAVQHVVEEV